ncbi:uncharacterized protein NFIA_061890 [Aspergillus fischeri NRRL 181]|uniref:Uncharacterized protein n=1 Tax=Neosartorya fischeri (strain ATCC 1020 / DSM 3700 / CBS 544.65 / FGSC A1164 / JCM 1740 / NRRL 181 / WB 181) TaxID=331117 RepID=A1D5N4_NEOFI|nr:conserved hypothetical protein [Aspergillus fischeri NRRL 181]EAW21028.1 conserved hypothetical protein [Aspergillus fischeri NRRL 181]
MFVFPPQAPFPRAPRAVKMSTNEKPPLSPAERAIVKSYGGWTQFMISFGLKPYELDDIYEAKSIVASLATDD